MVGIKFIPLFYKKKQYLHNTLLKIKKYHTIIQDSIIGLYKYKSMDIIKANDLHLAIHQYQELYDRLYNINNTLNSKKNIDFEDIATKIQEINNEFSILIKNYGTNNIMDLLNIQFGCDYINNINNNSNNKLDLISKFIHPIGFKLMDWKIKNTNVERMNDILHLALNQIAKISILLNPIIPNSSAKVLDALNIKTELRNLSFLEGKKIIADEIRVKELNILFKKIN